jgi:hypothetical protein
MEDIAKCLENGNFDQAVNIYMELPERNLATLQQLLSLDDFIHFQSPYRIFRDIVTNGRMDELDLLINTVCKPVRLTFSDLIHNISYDEERKHYTVFDMGINAFIRSPNSTIDPYVRVAISHAVFPDD